MSALAALVLALGPQTEVPYVVVPAERPWEAEAFRARSLAFRPAAGEPSENVRALDAAAAGLVRLERGSVRLFHSPGRKALAEEIALLMDRQHRLLAYYTRREFQALSVAVIGTEDVLPEPFGFWVVLDGTSAWSLRTTETALPLRSDDGFWAKTGKSWLYHGMLHECCHHGTCYDVRIMQHRWFCEGLSDYLGAMAAVCYSGDGDRAHALEWLEPLREVRKEREEIDVLARETWWSPAGGRANTKLETAGYAASQFVVAGIVHRRGFDWIHALFAALAEDPAPEQAEFLKLVERHTGERKLAQRLAAVPLDEVLAYLERGLGAGR